MELYLDTSVIGALFDNENPPRLEITNKLLSSIISNKHIGFILNIVIEEIEKAPSDLKEKLYREIRKIPFEMKTENDESFELVEIYAQGDFTRKGAIFDLRHLAIASVNGVDAVVSWNFRDIVNVRTRREIHSINLRLGYPLIEIVSPEEVIEYG